MVLLDADLGGAHLDTLLGCPHPTMSLGDFFRKRVAHLDELAVDTGVPGLQLIAGDSDSLAASSPHFSQKQKLIRHLKTITADLVILDLGAGTTFHTLDLFNAADLGLVVTVPEPTALQNCFTFIKSVILRDLERRSGVKRRDAVVGPLHRAFDPEDPEVRRALARHLPVLVNRARRAQADNVSKTLERLTRRFLGGGIELLGHVRDDDAVRQSVQQMQPVSCLRPDAPAALDVARLAAQLTGRGAGARTDVSPSANDAPAVPTPAHEDPANSPSTHVPGAATPAPPRQASRSSDLIEASITVSGQSLTLRTHDDTQARVVTTSVIDGDGDTYFVHRTGHEDPFFQRLSARPGDRARLHHVAVRRAVDTGRIQLELRRSA